MTTIQPTLPNERYQLLDVLRGFALLGVLIANMATLSGYAFLSEDAKQAFRSYTIDHFVNSFHLLWIDGKFYSLFSMLFGIGFGLQLQRSLTTNTNFKSLFRRRLLILLFLGLCHAIFLYPGDILTVYALLGFVLLLFRNFSNINLLRVAFILLLLPLVQYAIIWAVHLAHPPVPKPAGPRMLDQMIRMFRTGSYLDIIKANIGGLIFGRYPDLFFTGRFFKVLAMFLIGFYVALNKIYAQVPEYRSLFKKVILWGLIIGIPCNLVLATIVNISDYKELKPLGIIQPLAYAYGIPALCLSYAAIIALLYDKPAWKKRLAFFAPVGQLALTNYLLQSLICVFIFKSYGFALEAQVGPTQLLLIALAIYSLQVFLSHSWVRYFRFGPAEWLWRSLTYRAWQPFRKNQISNQSIAVS
ncbi:DUF418 domain-containing protein [Adhaeribacter pallidiroseus]|uniref:Putative 39.9 kDa protein in amylase 3'region n=1 Tax=Adhaeribacter pallidiroseus TaxID=2072847 RepID=A0A369QMS8_9BACT|nr:DUF418 domain-containing protein [Adhaeribacter pallidiroseus]RDC66233.1 putative 39.9 kDa protein in amylase 3'region [Adhaeribacter pallidiroseus]